MFNTDDYSHSTGGGSKILQPGEHYCRIIDVKLVAPSYNADAYNLSILLEGPDMGDDFEGLPIDREDLSQGVYRGMIATVNAGRYPFSEFEWKGKVIERDNQIFNWINGIATQMGVFEGLKIQADNIEDYVEKIREVLVNPDLWGTFTIGGREYYKEGSDYPNYNLYFPKKKGKDYPFTIKENDKGEVIENLVRYKEDIHLIKADKPAASSDVDSFPGQGEDDLAPTL